MVGIVCCAMSRPSASRATSRSGRCPRGKCAAGISYEDHPLDRLHIGPLAVFVANLDLSDVLSQRPAPEQDDVLALRATQAEALRELLLRTSASEAAWAVSEPVARAPVCGRSNPERSLDACVSVDRDELPRLVQQSVCRSSVLAHGGRQHEMHGLAAENPSGGIKQRELSRPVPVPVITAHVEDEKSGVDRGGTQHQLAADPSRLLVAKSFVAASRAAPSPRPEPVRH